MKKIKIHTVSGNIIITTVPDANSLQFTSPKYDSVIMLEFGKNIAYVNMRNVEYIEIADVEEGM